MGKSTLFIMRLTARLEFYMFFFIVPLAVYFVVIIGEHRGAEPLIIVRGAAFVAPLTLVFGLAARFAWLGRALGAALSGTDAPPPEVLRRARRRLLFLPALEGVLSTVRWAVGITAVALYVLNETGKFGGIEYLLVTMLVVPVSYTLMYFTSENSVTRLLAESGHLGRFTGTGLRRSFGLYVRTLLVITSVIIIPIVIFGYLLLLSRAGLIRTGNANLDIGVITALSILTILATAYESTINVRLGMRLTVDALRQLREGRLDAALPVATRDEIGVIAEHVNFLAEALRDQDKQNRFLTANLERKVEQRTEELSAAMEELTAANESLREARDELWGEMELAKKIQTILLPQAPCIDGCEAAVYMAPAKEVGGDYYDIISLPGVDWVVVGDVSGHGVSAGLVMMMAQTTIRTVLRNAPEIDPHRLLELVNDILYENLRMLGEERYMTMTALALRPDGSFRYAGLHEDLLIYRAAGGSVEEHETDGVWLGIYPDIGGQIDDQSLSLEPGDVLLLYTDGLVNAWRRDTVGGRRRPEEDMFGTARLAEILAARGGLGPSEILGGIRDALGEYTRDDDATVVILKRR